VTVLPALALRHAGPEHAKALTVSGSQKTRQRRRLGLPPASLERRSGSKLDVKLALMWSRRERPRICQNLQLHPGGPRHFPLRAAWIAATLTAGLLASPGSSAAAYGSPASHDPLERRELHEVQEQLARVRAAQRALRGQIEAMVAEVGALRERHEALSLVLQSKRQQAAALERRLDRLVPRLLTRQAETRERRARTAQALAELARRSRSVGLDSTTRARMLAISPLMFRQLRGLESSPDLLGRPERTIQRHAKLERSLRELTVAQERLAADLVQKRRQREGALRQLGALTMEVRMLAEKQVRLTSRLLRAQAAIAARADPRAAEPAMSGPPHLPGLRARGAAVAKRVFEPERRLATAERRSVSEVQAGAQVPGGIPGLPIVVAQPAWPTVPPAIRSLAATLHGTPVGFGPGDFGAASKGAEPLQVVFQPERGTAGAGADDSRRHRGQPPLLAMTERIARRALDNDDRTEMAFAAAPGQRVAAPVDGEIVFAGRFRSYGLLLIIEHEREYHTLLWGFARLAVGSGMPVRAGQVVGIMGAGSADPPLLHIERRRHGRPINLAASSSGIRG
jgi:septal ring factor EnvC (AmiA/AmiB activator)